MAVGIAITLFSFACGLAGALLVRFFGVGWGLVQVPNDRSSHVVPTPTGGGIGMVMGGLAAIVYVAATGETALWVVAALGAAIAAVGFADDRRPLSARLRLLLHLLVAALFLLVLDVLAPLVPPGWTWAAFPVALLACGWWINLFNFMDGIDGLAGTQTLTMALAASLLCISVQPGLAGEPAFWLLPALAAAALGFLALNWPPAKVFMGDAGAYFLAFAFLAAAALTIRAGWMTLPAWLVLAAAFVTDATLTLARRMAYGESPAAAHRRHAYQFLARRWASHRRVSLALAAINLLYLLPLAALCIAWPTRAWIPLALAYIPLIIGAFRAGAGARLPQTS